MYLITHLGNVLCFPQGNVLCFPHSADIPMVVKLLPFVFDLFFVFPWKRLLKRPANSVTDYEKNYQRKKRILESNLPEAKLS